MISKHNNIIGYYIINEAVLFLLLFGEAEIPVEIGVKWSIKQLTLTVSMLLMVIREAEVTLPVWTHYLRVVL